MVDTGSPAAEQASTVAAAASAAQKARTVFSRVIAVPTMRTSLRGDIHFDVGQDQLLEALDPVWREVTEYVFELDDGFEMRRVLVVAHGADGSTVAPKELLGSEYADQDAAVHFGDFFEHYGLI